MDSGLRPGAGSCAPPTGAVTASGCRRSQRDHELIGRATRWLRCIKRCKLPCVGGESNRVAEVGDVWFQWIAFGRSGSGIRNLRGMREGIQKMEFVGRLARVSTPLWKPPPLGGGMNVLFRRGL